MIMIYQSPEQDIIRKEDINLLMSFIEQLPELPRSIIELTYGLDESGNIHFTNEISQLLGISRAEINFHKREALRWLCFRFEHPKFIWPYIAIYHKPLQRPKINNVPSHNEYPISFSIDLNASIQTSLDVISGLWPIFILPIGFVFGIRLLGRLFRLNRK
jgi:hypothetical protein